MRFDTAQQMKLSQSMKLAPRMIQSMEILQMSLAELQERIDQELESNVTLETAEGERSAEDTQRDLDEAGPSAGERELDVQEGGDNASDFERLDEFANTEPEAFDDDASPRERTRDDYDPPARANSRLEGERDGKMDAMANAAAREASLTDQLLEQWAFSEVDEDLVLPGRLIIEHVDDDGYVRTELTEIANRARRDGIDMTPELLEEAIREVQLELDPPGLAARDARECLLLQIDAMAGDPDASIGADDRRAVRELIADHLDDLMHNRIPKVAQRTGMTPEQIQDALAKMRRLRLSPGRELVSESATPTTPDAIVEWDEESRGYIVYLTDGRLPSLQINREYALMSKDRELPKTDRDFIKTNLSNAQWLIEAVEQRRNTLLRVLRVVVAAQSEVFERGWEALKPLPMTQVADQLGIHVATVSRAVAGKHLQTPRGIFALRKFFTGGTQTESGEEMSWDAVKAAMKEVVDEEDKAKPLSDEAISKALKGRGIDIARRTVAKYRDQLGIPSARMRKQFG
ncbi:MAG: RNA polymerase factor sigma-54 [Planctomycetota bacterium]